MEKLLKSPMMRERFQATCIGVDAKDTALFKTWSLSLKSLRWEAIEEFSRELLSLEVPLRSYWRKDKFIRGISGTKYKQLQERSSQDSFEHVGVAVEAIDKAVNSETFWAGVAITQDVSFSAEFVGRWAEGCSCCEEDLLTNHATKRRRTKWVAHVNETTPCPYRGCRAVEISAGDWMGKLQRTLSDGQSRLTDAISKADPSDRQELLNDWVKSRSKLWGRLRIKLAYFSQLPWKL